MKNKNISGVSAPLLFFFFYFPNYFIVLYIINIDDKIYFNVTIYIKRRYHYDTYRK
nr:MAG TPA: hypothetical protein [Caudoviricetes sp.]